LIYRYAKEHFIKQETDEPERSAYSVKTLRVLTVKMSAIRVFKPALLWDYREQDTETT
jgi:hypothetical protein